MEEDSKTVREVNSEVFGWRESEGKHGRRVWEKRKSGEAYLKGKKKRDTHT